jgi:hypothetical protein
MFAAFPRAMDFGTNMIQIQESTSVPSMGSNSLSQGALPCTGVDDKSSSLVALGTTSLATFENPLLGSVLVLQQPLRKSKTQNKPHSHQLEHQITARYRVPRWLSYRAWQLCCLQSQRGWTWTLTTYNVIPGGSEQFGHAYAGRLSELQMMIADGRASASDQLESGETLLSVSHSGPSLAIILR